ncbi:hypothetical protein N7E02_21585 [Aliirhizobium terrae]|uniref:hypothetical protein n=1 Tax=Terrirhizobium terrae TaxID=2926709 RepID=UPI002578B8FA|nr:hypothetical protein [Rhizobium sp. CC-CFT758]WJH39404.1 hypothetical protein N7E02_21585 [Rhizobium sp. CC-CFT758]
MMVRRNKTGDHDDAAASPGSPSKPIPQHVAERLESEWKQMQDNNSRQPNQR